jgi:hypothetical protein
MAMIDTLKLARALRERGGFTPEAAEATAEAFSEALAGQVATKPDLEQLGHRLVQRMDKLAHDLTVRMFGFMLAITGLMNGFLFALLRIVPPPHP